MRRYEFISGRNADDLNRKLGNISPDWEIVPGTMVAGDLTYRRSGNDNGYNDWEPHPMVGCMMQLRLDVPACEKLAHEAAKKHNDFVALVSRMPCGCYRDERVNADVKCPRCQVLGL